MSYVTLSRRPRRFRRMSYAASEALSYSIGIAACVALIGALMALAYTMFAAKAEAAANRAGTDSYALVMVYNAPHAWREVAVARGISFAACDKQQRAVWSRDVPSVALAGGVHVPSVDAYCVANDRLPAGVISDALPVAPVPHARPLALS